MIRTKYILEEWAYSMESRYITFPSRNDVAWKTWMLIYAEEECGEMSDIKMKTEDATCETKRRVSEATMKT